MIRISQFPKDKSYTIKDRNKQVRGKKSMHEPVFWPVVREAMDILHKYTYRGMYVNLRVSLTLPRRRTLTILGALCTKVFARSYDGKLTIYSMENWRPWHTEDLSSELCAQVNSEMHMKFVRNHAVDFYSAVL